MLDCPNLKCGKKARRIIASDDGLRCDNCFEPKHSGMDAIIGRIRFHKWGVRMTEADANHIKTNRKRADGRFKPDPRWR